MDRRSASAAVLGASLALCGGAARAQADPDPWFGPDKALHFAVSGNLAAGGYVLGRAYWRTPLAGLAVGAGAALVLGLGKEAWDATGHGDPSLRDATWDVLGAATGLLTAWAIDQLFAPPRPRGARIHAQREGTCTACR
jgi:putative lipoprotein